MTNIVHFPNKKTPPPPIIEITSEDHRIKTSTAMYAKIMLAIHDALREHGPDVDKWQMISAALIAVVRDVSAQSAEPMVIKSVVRELADG